MRLELKSIQALSCLLLVLIAYSSTNCQTLILNDNWIDQLNLKGALPEKLLSTRSIVFYDHELNDNELKKIQANLQKIGIDAVAYFALDELMAGKDITTAFASYLTKREILNLVLVEKNNTYRISVTDFNGKENVLDTNQPSWSAFHIDLEKLLLELSRTASSLKRENLLINDLPEMGLPINPILGKRNEFFAVDVKVDPLAIPMFGDETLDKELEEIFKNNYPLKYKLTDPSLSEKELRKQGYFYVLQIVHTRASAAKEILGYDMTKSESAIVSVTYPGAQQELKNIPSNTPVYKIYLKHIDSGNVFLGTKWDADLTWQQAILNHLRGLKAELRIQ